MSAKKKKRKPPPRDTFQIGTSFQVHGGSLRAEGLESLSSVDFISCSKLNNDDAQQGLEISILVGGILLNIAESLQHLHSLLVSNIYRGKSKRLTNERTSIVRLGTSKNHGYPYLLCFTNNEIVLLNVSVAYLARSSPS